MSSFRTLLMMDIWAISRFFHPPHATNNAAANLFIYLQTVTSFYKINCQKWNYEVKGHIVTFKYLIVRLSFSLTYRKRLYHPPLLPPIFCWVLRGMQKGCKRVCCPPKISLYAVYLLLLGNV